MARLKQTPRLKGGTYSALAVLKFVEKAVKEEEKRLDMSSWLTAFRGKHGLTVLEVEPACGTVACMGGWINIATGHNQHNYDFDPGAQALKNLGFKGEICSCGDPDCTYDNFTNVPIAKELQKLFGKATYTPTQALKELDRIIVKHEKELKKQKVVVKAA